VTREEKKMIRIQIHNLLDNCQSCQFRSVTNASIHICPSCRIGKKMQALGKKLWKRDEKRRMAVINSAPNRRPWTAEEEEFIIQNLHMRCKELAEKLGRGYKAVQRKISELRQRGRIHDAS
jgi:ribosome-binding protein aMBF1 (putative translation factor)